MGFRCAEKSIPSMHRINLILFASVAVAASQVLAQTPTPAVLPPANAITTVANGVSIMFVPGSAPVLTANSASTADAAAPGLAIAASKTIRYIDKHGKPIDPASIKPSESLQPILDSGPNGRVIQTIMVDRN